MWIVLGFRILRVEGLGFRIFGSLLGLGSHFGNPEILGAVL